MLCNARHVAQWQVKHHKMPCSVTWHAETKRQTAQDFIYTCMLSPSAPPAPPRPTISLTTVLPIASRNCFQLFDRHTVYLAPKLCCPSSAVHARANHLEKSSALIGRCADSTCIVLPAHLLLSVEGRERVLHFKHEKSLLCTCPFSKYVGAQHTVVPVCSLLCRHTQVGTRTLSAIAQKQERRRSRTSR
jgi:hypothetical protein